MNKFDFAIQVTVEDDSTLVIRSNGQRKRNDGEEEGCKYIKAGEESGPEAAEEVEVARKCQCSSNYR